MIFKTTADISLNRQVVFGKIYFYAKEETKKRKGILMVSLFILMGTMSRMLFRDKLDRIRTVHVLQIFVAGAAFGVLLITVAGAMKKKLKYSYT